MVTRQTKKEIEKSAYRGYWAKAKDFYEMISVAFDFEQWNSVGLQSVQFAISATDALLAFYGKIRSTDQDHKAAANLLIEYVKDRETRQQANRFRNIVATKNLIQYEQRPFIRREAEQIKQQAERYFDWACRMLPDEFE